MSALFRAIIDGDWALKLREARAQPNRIRARIAERVKLMSEQKTYKTRAAEPDNRPITITMGLHEAHYILQAFQRERSMRRDHVDCPPLSHQADNLIRTLQQAMKEQYPKEMEGDPWVEPYRAPTHPAPPPATTVIHHHHYPAPRHPLYMGPQG